MTAQEALLVGVENGNERHFGQVQALAQQVDAYKHIVHAGTQVVHNLHAVERCNVAVYVVGAYVVGKKILGKFLCHALRERGDKHTRVVLATLHNLLKQVVYLVLARSHFDDGIEQSGRTYNLLNNNASSLLKLKVGRRCRNINHLIHHVHELVELQRAVVEGGRQTEAVLHKILLAGTVAAVHGAYLRHRHMALVDEHKEVFWEEVEQTVRTLTGFAPIEITRVVLDAGAMSKLLYHLHVVLNALLDALRPNMVANRLEEVDLLNQIVLNKAYC